MSVQESERLLAGARSQEATKARYAYDLTMLAGLLKVLLGVVLVGAVFWLLGQAIGSLAAIILGVLLFHFRDRWDG